MYASRIAISWLTGCLDPPAALHVIVLVHLHPDDESLRPEQSGQKSYTLSLNTVVPLSVLRGHVYHNSPRDDESLES